MDTERKSNHIIKAYVELQHPSGKIEDVVISGIPCVWDWDTNTREAAEQVKRMIAGKGTKITTVSFIKLDGTVRVINGLLKTTSNMVGSELGVKQGLAMAARGQVPIYELTSKRWKSFYADKVVNIT